VHRKAEPPFFSPLGKHDGRRLRGFLKINPSGGLVFSSPVLNGFLPRFLLSRGKRASAPSLSDTAPCVGSSLSRSAAAFFSFFFLSTQSIRRDPHPTEKGREEMAGAVALLWFDRVSPFPPITRDDRPPYDDEKRFWLSYLELTPVKRHRFLLSPSKKEFS